MRDEARRMRNPRFYKQAQKNIQMRKVDKQMQYQIKRSEKIKDINETFISKKFIFFGPCYLSPDKHLPNGKYAVPRNTISTMTSFNFGRQFDCATKTEFCDKMFLTSNG